MVINPNSVVWEQPKRWVKKDVRNGSVFFHFTNSKGQNNDVLTLRFSGNTGNIGTRSDLINPAEGEPAQQGAFAKLRAWHNLYLLTREPILLSDQTVNVQTITISSQLLPLPITFRGFYNRVLDLTESADQPNSRDYAFDFTVTGSNPDLDIMATLILDVLQDTPATGAVQASSLFASDGSIDPTGEGNAAGIPRRTVGT